MNGLFLLGPSCAPMAGETSPKASNSEGAQQVSSPALGRASGYPKLVWPGELRSRLHRRHWTDRHDHAGRPATAAPGTVSTHRKLLTRFEARGSRTARLVHPAHGWAVQVRPHRPLRPDLQAIASYPAPDDILWTSAGQVGSVFP
jgi:hypothetical protein